MIRRSLIALAPLCFVAACIGRAPAPRLATDPLVARIDSVANKFFALGGAPGMGVVVVRGSEVLYRRGLGLADVEASRPFTPASEFYVASITKSFTGLTAAVLAARGKVDLDAPLSRYLPALRLKSPLSADSITIRSLLAHTHGIANAGPLPIRLAYTGDLITADDRIRALEAHAAAQSGRAYAYGNIGYNVAAMAMEAATGSTWQRLIEAELLDPLRMRHTSPRVSAFDRSTLATPYATTPAGFKPVPYAKSDENMQSAGGLITTLDDMAIWLEAHINDGNFNGRQLLPREAFIEAHRNHVAGPIRARTFLPQVGYGFGWQISLLGADTILDHQGGFPGFSAHMSFMPATKTGIVIFANEGDLGTPQVEFLASAIYDVIRGRPVISADSIATVEKLFTGRRAEIAADLERRAARSQQLPFPLGAYIGNYRNATWGTIRVDTVGQRLRVSMGVAVSEAEVFDAARNQLRVELLGGSDVISVIMDGDRASRLEISSVRFERVP